MRTGKLVSESGKFQYYDKLVHENGTEISV